MIDERAKQAYQALEHVFHACQLEKLSKRLTVRAQHEYKIIQQIQRLVRKQSDIIIRRTNKSKVF